MAVFVLAIGFMLGRIFDGDDMAHDKTTTQTESSHTTKLNAVMSVEAITPSDVTIFDTIDANGIIAARQTAQVSGRINGAVIERVLAQVGDRVRAGQVLAVLDASSLKDAYVQAQADLEQAIASAEKARVDLARTEPLLDIDAISRQQIDAYRTTARQADANVIAAKARLNNAITKLNHTNITAPISGVISERQAQIGAATNGGSLFTIIKDGALEWQATLSPVESAKLSIGQEAVIMTPDAPVVGKITRLSPTANKSREMTVHVAIPKGAPLSAGMYQTGKFVLNQSSLLAVPKSAIMTTDGYTHVWTLIPKDQNQQLYQVVRTKVDILGYQGQMAAVNLSPDVLVVAKSAGFLAENDIVRVATINANTNQLMRE